MTEVGLLTPGSHRVAGLTDDRALTAAMVRVETAWFGVLADHGAATAEQRAAVLAGAEAWRPDLDALAAQGEEGGNPVLPVLHGLRAAVAEQDKSAAALLHRGLTSQDVLDSALMLLALDTLRRVDADLETVVLALGALARDHRESLMAGRTLTQHAVPVSFGLEAAQWLTGVLDALEQVEKLALPAQCGGAAGTLALLGELLPAPLDAAQALAVELGLDYEPLPWHTRRTPVTRLGDALVDVVDAVGVIGANVAVLSRPEIAELTEGPVEGRGVSSTMPHKRNPVLSVLLRSAAQQAPLLAAQLHLASGAAVDQRPDGAWHAEWPSLRRLLTLTATATSQAAELVAHLEVHAETMRERAVASAPDLLAERGGDAGDAGDDGDDGDPAHYLGSTVTLVDRALARLADRERRHD